MDRRTKWLVGCFLSVELGLYVAFLFLRLNVPNGFLQYLSIVLCFLFVLLIPKKETADLTVIRFAMAFTVLADLFLTLLRIEQILGTALFAIAQLAFAYRLWAGEKTFRVPILLLRLAFVAGMELLAWGVVGSNYDVLIFTAVFYYANLLFNAFHAVGRFRRHPLFAIGLCFYLCCDLMVGLANSGGYLVIPPTSIWAHLLACPWDLTWFFYLPSQVLIVLSVLPKGPKQKIIP